jgi:hypothetical protein
MMTFVRSGGLALFALAGLAAAASAPAKAADDKSTISAVGELFGLSSDPSAASIDYHERPKLVLPPRIGELPPPRENARPAGWPSDTTTNRKRGSDRYAHVPNAPAPEKKPGLMERVRGPASDSAPGTDDEPGLLQRVLMRRAAVESAPSTEEPSRRMLTEPPSGYRKPTMDLGKLPETEAKKSSWWNPLGYFGNKDENDPVAETGAKAKPGQSAAAGAKPAAQAQESSSWFRMPNFIQKNLEHD